MTASSEPGQQGRILLLSPYFFGYEKEMQATLERLGYEVDLFDTRPSASSLSKALLRLRPQYMRTMARTYYAEMQRHLTSDYDYVLVIKGEGLFQESVQALRQKYQTAKFILYSYDSVRNNRHFLNIMPLFDKVLSFDDQDSRAYPSIRHEPLFYIDKYVRDGDQHTETWTYDASFVGSLHADRYAVVERIFAQLPRASIYKFYFYASKSIFALQRWISRDFRNTPVEAVSFTPLSHQEIADVFEKSRIIIDVQHPDQTGLTMRTFELLAAKKKMITTNTQVILYDFYHPDNICVVDRNEPRILETFLNTGYRELPDEIYRRYHLAHWLQRVLS